MLASLPAEGYRYMHRGDSAVLQVTGRGSESDVGMMTQLNLSAYSYHKCKVGAHHYGPGEERGDPINASAGGAAIAA